MAPSRDSLASKHHLAARGETPAAFGRRCIPADRVAPPSHMEDMLGRRALSAGRLAALGATLEFHPGLQGQQAPTGYDDTPMQPNGKWRIHDGKRPQPAMVTPGRANPAPLPGPSDAIALLGAGSDLGAWQMTDGSPATWVMKDGIVETGKGMMRTKTEFTDFQLHVEFATPGTVKGN